MKRILMMVLMMVFLGVFVSGCAGKRHYLPADGGNGGKRAAPAEISEQDKELAMAYLLGSKVAGERKEWKRKCLALRSADPYATYEDCRKVLGDDRDQGSRRYNDYRNLLREGGRGLW